MKVYIVFCYSLYDMSDECYEHYCFSTKLDAIKKFNDLVDGFMSDNTGLGLTIERTNTYFCAFEDGHYSEDHCIIELIERDVL